MFIDRKKIFKIKNINFFICCFFADIDNCVEKKKINSSFIIFSNLYLKNARIDSIGVSLYIKSLLKQRRFINYYSVNLKLKKKKNIKTSEFRKNNNYLNYFISLACKKGYKVKTTKIVKDAFKLFFELFLFCNDNFFFKKYYYFSILKSYSQS